MLTVADAIAQVNRADYLPESDAHFAEIEIPYPICDGVTVPTRSYTELVVGLLDLKPWERVFEIGTGSGYQAAVMSCLCSEVVTCDIEPESTCALVLPSNVSHYPLKDGRCGIPSEGEFDAVLVTCGMKQREFQDYSGFWLLSEGGRVVVPIGSDNHYEIRKYVKQDGELRDMGPYAFANVVHIRR
jgi:protein-L-isoaspartate(D-aspartate) O-methyltransferase